jgi:hypothetical protein
VSTGRNVGFPQRAWRRHRLRREGHAVKRL